MDGNIVASYPARNRSEDKLASLLVVDLPGSPIRLFNDNERRVVRIEFVRVTTVIVHDRSFGGGVKFIRHVIGRLVADGLDTLFRLSDDVGKAVINGNCYHLDFNLVSVDEVGDVMALDRVFDPGENLTAPVVQ